MAFRTGWFCQILIAGVLVAVHAALAATPTPEMQSAIRVSTFEVVLRKADSDPLSYEKPLPLDLIPFQVRNDHYWPVGTAFAIGPDTYVTAAHVFRSVLGSHLSPLGLRDGAGHVYPVGDILKFSAHEDFVVFTVTGAPAAVPLPTSAEHRLDEVVFAVGNALGEGVVIRDGLLTSETPEQQDGRWNWLRFSAAASPGNSGGPLFDSQGRVIGVITAKSPNENLNYALPITRVLDGSSTQAGFDLRYSIKLPNARATQTAVLKSSFPLPKSYANFSDAYRKLITETTSRDLRQMRVNLAAELFPKGDSARLLATVYQSELPAFVQQDHNDAWDAVRADNVVDQPLPGNGLVTTGGSLGVTVFRLRRPDGAADDKFYHDSSLYMDLLLKGLKLQRPVGDQAIRVTSLGHAMRESVYEDRYGRRWRVDTWPVDYANSVVVCYALPSPEGYVGFVQMIPASQTDSVDEYLRLLADDVYVGYSGTLKQWRAFLARREFKPRTFDESKLAVDEAMTVGMQSPRIAFKTTKEILDTNADSELELDMAYLMSADRLSWDVGTLRLYKNQDQQIYVGFKRHVKPAGDGDKPLLEEWNRVSSGGPGFNGSAGHDADYKEYWIHEVLSAPWKYPGVDPAAVVLYDAFYGTKVSSYPRDLQEGERRWVEAIHVLEH